MLISLDTEFIEDGHTIDLISIGMASEDGRELYLQNMDCKFRRANPWVKENVFPHLRYFDVGRMKPLLGPHAAPGGRSIWYPHKLIGEMVKRFVGDDTPIFIGWCASYDHVALCQLFGMMIDLPKGWPYYIRDLQYLLDERGISDDQLPPQEGDTHNALSDAKYQLQIWQSLTQGGTPQS